MNWLSVLLLLLALALPQPATAALVSGSETGGRLKSFNLYRDRLPNSSGEGLLSSNSFRYEVTGRLADAVDFALAAEQQLLWSDPPALATVRQRSVNRLLRLEKSWTGDDRFAGRFELDRLLVRGELGDTRWTLGRQALGFGRISLFSPLDLIAPFPPDALDVDVRPGVDALNLTRYFGLGGQLGGTLVVGDRTRHNSYLLTFSENVGRSDLLLIGGSLRQRALLGFGLAGELGALGLKGELCWYRGQAVGRPGGDLQRNFAIAAVEAWYRFDNGLVLLAEYLYNGPGSEQPSDYPLVAASAPLREGLSYLLGRHYLLLGPSYELHPLVTASGLLLQNLQDGSLLLRPQLAISLADNLQLDLFWAFAIGRKTQRDPLTGLPRLRSEFGAAGDSGGLLLRKYF